MSRTWTAWDALHTAAAGTLVSLVCAVTQITHKLRVHVECLTMTDASDWSHTIYSINMQHLPLSLPPSPSPSPRDNVRMEVASRLGPEIFDLVLFSHICSSFQESPLIPACTRLFFAHQQNKRVNNHWHLSPRSPVPVAPPL